MRSRSLLSVANFFVAAHFFLIVYILTPYLAQFMPESLTGLPISLGALITLGGFLLMPRLVIRFGPRRLAALLGLIEGLVLLWLAMNPSPIAAIILVALACAVSPLVDYQLDLLLEAAIQNEGTTGRIRTAFLTAGNLALIFGPLLVGALLDSSEAYARVFLVASASLLPFIAIILSNPNKLSEGATPTLSNMRETFTCILRDKDLRAVAIANLVLQFFYHLAPLYIPLYLHNVLGMPWNTLGWMFAIMLVPFVVLEYPAGWLADRLWGDKELMVFGFAISGFAFAAIAWVTGSTVLWVTLAILVLTRVGAALVEAMAEGHFFRRVSERDASTVSVFRAMRPVGALVAPIVGSLILVSGVSYELFFISTGLLVAVVGMLSALAITDIK